MDLSGLPITHQAQIPEAYRDDMGHMNVMWYAHLCDRATFHFFKSFGFDEAHFKANNAGCFALAAHYRYLAEVRIGQRITLRTRALGQSPKRLHLMHFMTLDGAADKLAFTAEVLGTHIDMGTRRSSALAPQVAAAYGRILAEHQKLHWQPPLCGAIQA